MQKSNPLVEQSIDFSVCVVDYYKWLSTNKNEFVMSRQLLKSGTSIGANIHEANFAVARLILSQKCRLRSKKHQKQNIG